MEIGEIAEILNQLDVEGYKRLKEKIESLADATFEGFVVSLSHMIELIS